MFFNKNVSEQDQYHQTIRNLVVVIGSLFSKMILVRKNHKSNEIEEKISVPINFANRDKMLTLVREAPKVEDKNTNFTLPRIGFAFEGLSYDAQRQLPKTGGRGRPTKDEKNKKDAIIMYNGVPYNFEFSVSVIAKYAEDLTQLVEKILPYFTPNLNVTYRAIPELSLDIDVPILLNSVNWTDQYEGLEERRLLIADLSLTAKSYIFPPIQNYPKVNTVFVETHTLGGMSGNDNLQTARKIKVLNERGTEIKTESSGNLQDENSSNLLNSPYNENSLIKIYGYDENDDFGFKSFVYEGSNYDSEEEVEQAWANNTID